MADNLIAGIVTYNPDMKRLKENIDAVYNQVVQLVIVDNSSLNIDSIISLGNEYNKVNLVCNNENLGIAMALNQEMEYAKKHGFEWMLSLDQDSICPENFCEQLMEFCDAEDNIAIVAPVIQDKNMGMVGHCPEGNYGFVRSCITSGAIVNVAAWEECGRYDESMYIDSVDIEFCYRVRKFGYKVLQTPKVLLIHEIGNGRCRRFLIWKVKIMGHTAFRKYYISRNNVYYPLKHKLFLFVIRGYFRNIRNIIFVLLYEDKKKSKLSSIFSGTVDGTLAGLCIDQHKPSSNKSR